MSFDYIPTIRYMGNKKKLLKYIIPIIDEITPINGVVCDLMSGTSSVGYALKSKYRIISNDIQLYSSIIARAIVENNSVTICPEKAKSLLQKDYMYNMINPTYTLFSDNYSNTYFSHKQAKQIDSIRYSIEKNCSKYEYDLFMVALMNAVCNIQSTPGHFAQFLNNSLERVKKIQKIDLWDVFLDKCNIYNDIVFSEYKNIVYNEDAFCLLDRDEMKGIDTMYIDTPYTNDQYSRFYHLLETLVKYDYPKLEFKGLYRNDRYKSTFSLNSKANDSFDLLFEKISRLGSNIVMSYSNSGVVSVEFILKLAKKYYKFVDYKEIDYNHSSQGKGSKKIKEIVFVFKGSLL